LYHHPSSGAQITVSTASVICHAVTASCRYRERVGTGLSVLWVALGFIFNFTTPHGTNKVYSKNIKLQNKITKIIL
jgi:hypothetical protein